MTQCDIAVMGDNIKSENMEETQKVVKFEMYIDATTQQAMQTGKGVVPDLFRPALGIGKTVPFKAWQPDHSMALDGFARAYRRRSVNGYPVFRIEACMEESKFLARALAGDIILNATMPGTVSFAKPFTQQNFPSLEVDLIKIPEEQAMEMLLTALQALAVKRKAIDVLM